MPPHEHVLHLDNHSKAKLDRVGHFSGLHLSTLQDPEVDEDVVKSVDEMAINEKMVETPVSDDERDDDSVDEEGEEENEEEDEEDDDDGWITASNIKQKRREIDGRAADGGEEQKHVKVACMTTDFAMQGRNNKQ